MKQSIWPRIVHLMSTFGTFWWCLPEMWKKMSICLCEILCHEMRCDYFIAAHKFLKWYDYFLSAACPVDYKVAVLTKKICITVSPAYLSCDIKPCKLTCTRRSSDTLLLAIPITRTEFTKHAFRCSAASVWNLLPSLVTSSGYSPMTLKSWLKTYLFRFAVDCMDCDRFTHLDSCNSDVCKESLC